MKRNTDKLCAQLGHQLTGCQLRQLRHAVYVRSAMAQSKTLVVVAHGESRPGNNFKFNSQYIENIGFVAPKGRPLVSSLQLLAAKTPLIISEQYTANERIENYRLKPLSASELEAFKGDLPAGRDYLFPAKTLMLSKLLKDIGQWYSGNIILHICRNAEPAETAPEQDGFLAFTHISKEAIALMQFGTGKNGSIVSQDTGDTLPVAKKYADYASDYLADLADEVATFQNPKLNAVTIPWLKQSSQLREVADGQIQHFAEEIAIGRQLGYYDKTLIPRLNKFRQSIEKVVGHSIELPVDNQTAPSFTNGDVVPGHDLKTDRISLTNALEKAVNFSQGLTSEQRTAAGAGNTLSDQDIAHIQTLLTELDHSTIPLSKAAPEAFGYFRRLDQAVSKLSRTDDAAARLETDQLRQAHQWSDQLTPGLQIQSLQDRGAKVVLEGEPIVRDSGVTGTSFKHILATNIDGLYIGYNGSEDEAQAAVDRINSALDVSNPDHGNFAKQLFAASKLASLNNDEVSNAYKTEDGATGFVYGLGQEGEKPSVTSLGKVTDDGDLHSLVSVVAGNQETGTTAIGGLYRQLGDVISQSAFATTDTGPDGSLAPGKSFEAKINDTHSFRWTSVENQASTTGTGFLGPDPDTVGGSLAIGQISQNSYLAANNKPQVYTNPDADSQIASSLYTTDPSRIDEPLPEGFTAFKSYKQAATYLNHAATTLGEADLIDQLHQDRSFFDAIKTLSKPEKKQIEAFTGQTPESYYLGYARGRELGPDEPNPAIFHDTAKLSEALVLVATQGADSTQGVENVGRLTAVLESNLEHYRGVAFNNLKDNIVDDLQKRYGGSDESNDTISQQFDHAFKSVDRDTLAQQDFSLTGYGLTEGGLISQPYQDKVGLYTLGHALGEDTSNIAEILKPSGRDYSRIIQNFIESNNAAADKTNNVRGLGFETETQITKALVSTVSALAEEGASQTTLVQGVIDALNGDQLSEIDKTKLAAAVSPIKTLADADSIDGNPLILPDRTREQLSHTLGAFNPDYTIEGAAISGSDVHYLTNAGDEVPGRILPLVGADGEVSGYRQIRLNNGDDAYVATDGSQPSFVIKAAFRKRLSAAVSDDLDVTPDEVAYSFDYQKALITDANRAKAGQRVETLTPEELVHNVGEKLTLLKNDSSFHKSDSGVHKAYDKLLQKNEDYLNTYSDDHDPQDTVKVLDALGPDLTPEHFKQFQKDVSWLGSKDAIGSPEQVKTSFNYYLSHLEEPDDDIPGRQFDSYEFSKLIVDKFKSLDAIINKPFEPPRVEFDHLFHSGYETPFEEREKEIQQKNDAERTFHQLLDLTHNYSEELGRDNPGARDPLFLAISRRFPKDSPLVNEIKGAVGYEDHALVTGRFGEQVRPDVNIGEFDHLANAKSGEIFRAFILDFSENGKIFDRLNRAAKFNSEPGQDSFGKAEDYTNALGEILKASNIITDPNERAGGDIPEVGKKPLIELRTPFTEETFIERLNNATTAALESYAEKGEDASPFIEGLDSFLQNVSIGGLNKTRNPHESEQVIDPILKLRQPGEPEGNVNTELVKPVLDSKGLLGIFELVTAIDGHALKIDPRLRAAIGEQRAKLHPGKDPYFYDEDERIEDFTAQAKSTPLYQAGVSFTDQDGAEVNNIPLVNGDLKAQGYTRFTLQNGDQLYVSDADQTTHFTLSPKVADEIHWLNSDDIHGSPELVAKSIAYHDRLVAEGVESQADYDKVLIAKTAAYANAGEFETPGYHDLVNKITDRATELEGNPSAAQKFQTDLKAALTDPDAFIHQTTGGNATQTAKLNELLPELDPEYSAKVSAFHQFAETLGLSESDYSHLQPNLEGYGEVIGLAKDQASRPDGFTLVEPDDATRAQINAEFQERISAGFNKSVSHLVEAGVDTTSVVEALTDYVSQDPSHNAAVLQQGNLIGSIDQVDSVNGKAVKLSQPAREALIHAAGELEQAHVGPVAANVTFDGDGIHWLDDNQHAIASDTFDDLRLNGTAQGYDRWTLTNGEEVFHPVGGGDGFALKKPVFDELTWLTSDKTDGSKETIQKAVQFAEERANHPVVGETGPAALLQEIEGKLNQFANAGKDSSEAYKTFLQEAGIGKIDGLDDGATPGSLYTGSITDKPPAIAPDGSLVGFSAQTLKGGVLYTGRDGQYLKITLDNGDILFSASRSTPEAKSFVVGKETWNDITWLGGDGKLGSDAEVANAIAYAKKLVTDEGTRFTQNDFNQLVKGKLDSIAVEGKDTYDPDEASGLVKALKLKSVADISFDDDNIQYTDSRDKVLDSTDYPAVSGLGTPEGYQHYTLGDGSGVYLSTDAGKKSFVIEPALEKQLSWLSSDETDAPASTVDFALKYLKTYADKHPDIVSQERVQQEISRKIQAYVSADDTQSEGFTALVSNADLPLATGFDNSDSGPRITSRGQEDDTRFASLPILDGKGEADGYHSVTLSDGDALYVSDDKSKSDFVVSKHVLSEITWLQSDKTKIVPAEVSDILDDEPDLITPISIGESYRYGLGLVAAGKLSDKQFRDIVSEKLKTLGEAPDGAAELAALKRTTNTQDVSGISVDENGVRYLDDDGKPIIGAGLPAIQPDGNIEGYDRYDLHNGDVVFLAKDNTGAGITFTDNTWQKLHWLSSDDTTASPDVVKQSVDYYRALAEQGGDFTQADFNKLVTNKFKAFESQPEGDDHVAAGAQSDALNAFVKENGIDNLSSFKLGRNNRIEFSTEGGQEIDPANLPLIDLGGNTQATDTVTASYSQTKLADGSVLFTKVSGSEPESDDNDEFHTPAGSQTSLDHSDEFHTPVGSQTQLDNDTGQSTETPVVTGPDQFVISGSLYKSITWLLSDEKSGTPAEIRNSVEYARGLATTDSTKLTLIKTIGRKLVSIGKDDDGQSASFKALSGEAQVLIQEFEPGNETGVSQLYGELQDQFDSGGNNKLFDTAFPEETIRTSVRTITQTLEGLSQTGDAAIEKIGGILGDSNLRETTTENPQGLSNEAIWRKLGSEDFDHGLDGVLTPQNVDLLHSYVEVLGTTVKQQKIYEQQLTSIDSAISGKSESDISKLSLPELLDQVKQDLPDLDTVFTPDTAERVKLQGLGDIRAEATKTSKKTTETLLDQITDIQKTYQEKDGLGAKPDGSDPDLGDSRAAGFKDLAAVAASSLPEGIDLPTHSGASLTVPKNPVTAEALNDAVTTIKSKGYDRSLLILKARRLGARLEKSVADIVKENNLSPEDVPILGTIEANVPKPGATNIKGEPLDLKTNYSVDFYNPTSKKITRIVTSDSTLSEVRSFLDDNTKVALSNKAIADADTATEGAGRSRITDVLGSSGSGGKDYTDVAGANTLNAAFSVQALISYFERKKVEHITGDPQLVKALRAHEDLNAARIAYGVGLDAAHVASAFKTLYSQSTKSAATSSLGADAEATSASAGTIFSAAGQIGVGAIDLAFSAASTGLDIYELTRTKSDVEKATIGTQLAFDAAGTVISATSLGLGVASLAGVAAAGAVSAALGGAGVIFAGLGVGVAALVDAYGQVLDEAKQVGKWFDSVNKTYKNNGFTYDKTTNTITTVGQGSVDEVNFRTGKVTFGDTKAQSIKRTKYDDSANAGTEGIIWIGGVPEDDTNKKDDFTLYAGMGYKHQVDIPHSSASTIVVPVTPHSRFYDYTYNQDPGDPFQHDTGFDIARGVEKRENFDFDFYSTPASWILESGKQDYYNTTIHIVLDDKPRAIVVPKIPKAYQGYVSHHIQGDGSQYVVAVGDKDVITLDSDAGKRSTWVINTQDLSGGNISVDWHEVHVGDAHVFVNDRGRSSVLIDDKSGDTFLADFATRKALAVVINGKNYSTHDKLVSHIEDLRKEGKLGTQLRVTHYKDQHGFDIGSAIYDVKNNDFITTALVQNGATLVNVISTDNPHNLLAAPSTQPSDILKGLKNEQNKIAIFTLKGKLYAYDETRRSVTETFDLPKFAGSPNTGSGAQLVAAEDTANGFHLIYQGSWKGSSTITYGIAWNNQHGRFELSSISGDSTLFNSLKNGQQLNLDQISERLGGPLALANWVKVTEPNQTPAFIRGSDGEVLKPQAPPGGDYITDHVYHLNQNPGSLAHAESLIKNEKNITGEGEFSLKAGQSLDFGGTGKRDLWAFFEGKTIGDWYKKNVGEQSDTNLVHELSGRVFLSKGTHQFSFRHDDDLKFTIGGKTLIDSSTYDHGKWSQHYAFTADHSGEYDLSAIYTQGGGAAKLEVHVDDQPLTVKAQDLDIASSDNNVPGQILNTDGFYLTDRVTAFNDPLNNIDDALSKAKDAGYILASGDYQLKSLDFSQHDPYKNISGFFGSQATQLDEYGALGGQPDIDVLHQINGRIYLKHGQHKFTFSHDDGFRLSIGGKQIVNSDTWDKNKPHSVEFTADHDGYYDLNAAYFQAKGGADLKVSVDNKIINAENTKLEPYVYGDNLIVNGGFEEFTANNGGTSGIQKGGIKGWQQQSSTITQDGKTQPDAEVYIGKDASDPDPNSRHEAILNSSNSWISQKIKTVKGQYYHLTISAKAGDDPFASLRAQDANNPYLKDEFSDDCSFSVKWNNKIVGTANVTEVKGWKTFQFTVEGTGGENELEFSGLYVHLDKVDLRKLKTTVDHKTYSTDNPIVYIDPNTRYLFQQSSIADNKPTKITLGNSEYAAQSVDSLYHESDGSLVAKASDGNVWNVDKEGHSALKSLGDGWFKNAANLTDISASIEALTGVKPTSDTPLTATSQKTLNFVPADIKNAPGQTLHLLYDANNQKWLFYPKGDDNAKLLNIDTQSNSAWFYDDKSHTFYEGKLLDDKGLKGILRNGVVIDERSEPQPLIHKLALSNFKLVPNGIAAEADGGYLVEVKGGTATLAAITSDYTAKHGDKISLSTFNTLRATNGLHTPHVIPVLDKNDKTTGWFNSANQFYFSTKDLDGTGASSVGLSPYGDKLYVTTNLSNGEEALYQVTSRGKPEKLVEAAFIQRVESADGKSASLLVQLDNDQTINHLPWMSDTTKLFIAAADHDAITLDSDSLKHFNTIHLDLSQLKDENGKNATTITFNNALVTPDTTFVEDGDDLAIYNGKSKQLIVLDGAAGTIAAKVKLKLGDLPTTSLGQIENLIHKQGISPEHQYLKGEAWLVKTAPSTIAEAQTLVKGKPGIGYNIKQLAFDDPGDTKTVNGIKDNTLAAFFGANATLTDPNDKKDLADVDDKVVHQIDGKIYLKAGKHQFAIHHDDGLKLSINNQVLINKNTWDDKKTDTVSFTAKSDGYYNLNALYYEDYGASRLKVDLDGKVLSGEDPNSVVKGIPIRAVFADSELASSTTTPTKSVETSADALLKALSDSSVAAKSITGATNAGSGNSAADQHHLDHLVQAIASFDGKPDAQLADKELQKNHHTGGLAEDPS